MHSQPPLSLPLPGKQIPKLGIPLAITGKVAPTAMPRQQHSHWQLSHLLCAFKLLGDAVPVDIARNAQLSRGPEHQVVASEEHLASHSVGGQSQLLHTCPKSCSMHRMPDLAPLQAGGLQHKRTSVKQQRFDTQLFISRV